jgi:hypothetical protein
VYNLIGLCLRFESHIPENVVDQMNDILVQQENLLHNSSFDRVAEIKLALQGSAQRNAILLCSIAWSRCWVTPSTRVCSGFIVTRFQQNLSMAVIDWTSS